MAVAVPSGEPPPPPEFYRRTEPAPPPPDPARLPPGVGLAPEALAELRARAQALALVGAVREVARLQPALEEAGLRLRQLRLERDEALAGAQRERAVADAALREAGEWRRRADEARDRLASAERHRAGDEAHLRAMLWGAKGHAPMTTTPIEERMTRREDAREAALEVRARVASKRRPAREMP